MLPKTGCEYHQRADGIYHFIFYDLHRSTIDLYFRHLETIYPTIPAHQQVQLLLDASPSRGLIPMLKYITDKSRELDIKLPQRPRILVAIVMEMNVFSRVLDTTLRLFIRSRDRLQFFDIPEINQAVEWLHRTAAPSGD